jgi:sugar phosphate isomerase/epimerase
MKSQLCINNFTYRRYSFDYFLRAAKRLGFENIELSGCHPHFTRYEAEVFPTEAFAAKIRAEGLKVPVIEPEQNFLPVNIASEQEYLRKASIEALSFYIRRAGVFSCDKVIIYPGKGMMDFPLEGSRKLACESIRELADEAGKYGVTLLLQNVSTFISGLTPNSSALAAMLDEIDDDSIGLSINSCAVAAGGETMEDYFVRFGDRIKAVQLSNSDDEDEQLEIADGDQDFEAHVRTLKKYGFNGPVALEITMEEYAENPDDVYEDGKAIIEKLIDTI